MKCEAAGEVHHLPSRRTSARRAVPSQEPGTATRVGGAGANPGFWRHRDGNGHEQHGLPSTAIYNPLYAPPYAAHTEECVLSRRDGVVRRWTAWCGAFLTRRTPMRVSPAAFDASFGVRSVCRVSRWRTAARTWTGPPWWNSCSPWSSPNGRHWWPCGTF